MKKYFHLLSIVMLVAWFAVVITGCDEQGMVNAQDMVLIPAGEFRMGGSENNEKPVHSVYVDAFYMDKYEVTNAQYAEFLNAKGKHAEGGITWYHTEGSLSRIEFVSDKYSVKTGYENHPVTNVTWYGAMAYAIWKGKRLPTEAEWEKAARGGLAGQEYPWGNTIDSTKANYARHIKDTTAVGAYPANGYGLHDMAGNVLEWCLDGYDVDFYAISSARNPLSGANSIKWLMENYQDIKSSRVLRGGSCYDAEQLLRVAFRAPNTPSYPTVDIGFRCVKAVTP